MEGDVCLYGDFHFTELQRRNWRRMEVL